MTTHFIRIIELIRLMNHNPDAVVSTPEITDLAYRWQTTQRNVYRYIGSAREVMDALEERNVDIKFPKKGKNETTPRARHPDVFDPPS